MDLAVTALDLACPPGGEPLEYEGLRERYLPEVTFRGRTEHRNSQYALYAAACLRGGLQPDLRGDAGWRQTPLWTYAVFAVVIYSRVAADRRTLPVGEIVVRIGERHQLDFPTGGQQDSNRLGAVRGWYVGVGAVAAGLRGRRYRAAGPGSRGVGARTGGGRRCTARP